MKPLLRVEAVPPPQSPGHTRVPAEPARVLTDPLITLLPGQTGNAVLAGHRDTFFAAPKEITRGDLIRVHLRNGGAVDYRVDHWTVVGRDAVEVMETTAEPRLRLIACYPFDFIGPSPPAVHCRSGGELHPAKLGQ